MPRLPRINQKDAVRVFQKLGYRNAITMGAWRGPWKSVQGE